MPNPRYSAQEMGRMGRELYEARIRKLVETEENLGKIISIDVETGDYEIGDSALSSSDAILERKPDAQLYGMRIGYNAVYAIGGAISRTYS
jgi:hypothetical protein